MPADVDENDTALETLFSEGDRLGLGLSGFLLEIHDGTSYFNSTSSYFNSCSVHLTTSRRSTN